MGKFGRNINLETYKIFLRNVFVRVMGKIWKEHKP